jgi:hypothetical protein
VPGALTLEGRDVEAGEELAGVLVVGVAVHVLVAEPGGLVFGVVQEPGLDPVLFGGGKSLHLAVAVSLVFSSEGRSRRDWRRRESGDHF